MRSALARAGPEWSSFEIRPAATYLGYSLGPAAGQTRRAGQTRLAEALNKFEERVDAIAAAGPRLRSPRRFTTARPFPS